MSGATAIAAAELADKSRQFGTGSDAVFDDLEGASAVRSMIDAHKTSRAVDHFILNANDPSVRTALVFPPVVYGRGSGPVHTTSVQVPALARATLLRKRGLRVGPGLSRWGNVHIEDLSALFVRLIEEAAAGNSDKKLWDENGLYLTGVGEMVRYIIFTSFLCVDALWHIMTISSYCTDIQTFGEISQQVATAAANQGFIPDNVVDEVDDEEANKLLPHGTILFGTNARSNARRGKELLDWSPKGQSLQEVIPDAVKDAAQA